MPIYEFFCQSCNKTFEKLSRSNVQQAECPDCGKTADKAISIPSPSQIGSGTAAPPCATGGGCGGGSGFT